MIPYFSMDSTKKTMRNKGTRFGYKNFVLTSNDVYLYHAISYSEAKSLHGAPGKDLTSRVALDFLIKLIGIKTNLASDNWYTSTKMLSILTALDIPNVFTAVFTDCLGTAHVRTTK